MAQPISGIYKITNMVNGHLYIGKAKDIHHRWIEHKSTAFLPHRREYKYPLYAAMRKYGIDNFKFEILEEIPLNQYDLISDDRERYYIKMFNAYTDKENYNMTPGGDGGLNRKLTTAEKERISKSLKDWYQTEAGQEKKRQQSQFLIEHPIPPHKHTEEWKKQHSEQMSGEKNANYGKHPNGQKVRCVETGLEYPSIRAAAQAIGISHTSINSALSGKQHTAGGYHWERI